MDRDHWEATVEVQAENNGAAREAAREWRCRLKRLQVYMGGDSVGAGLAVCVSMKAGSSGVYPKPRQCWWCRTSPGAHRQPASLKR